MIGYLGGREAGEEGGKLENDISYWEVDRRIGKEEIWNKNRVFYIFR